MNKRLLVDIGNSRLKWCIARGDTLGKQHALELDGRGLPELASLLKSAAGVTAVVVSSVAGTTRDRALSRQLRAARLPAPRFIASEPEAAGVTNGYREPWRLGVDRWVAAIGAWHDADRRAVCVVDIGTATTVDVIDATGRHRGGLIVPGPSMMMQSLLAGTRGIAPRAQGGRRGPSAGLGRDTASALELGAKLATAALVARAAQDARREQGRGCRVYLTGGGAPAIQPLLDVEVRHCPDLVLRGLAVLAR